MTFAGAEKRRVDEQQQDVVEEALQHRCLHTSLDQVLRADRRPADEQRQDLAHHNGLQKVPVEEEHLPEYFKQLDSELYALIHLGHHSGQRAHTLNKPATMNSHHVKMSLKL